VDLGLRGRDVAAELRLAAKMTLAGTLAWWVASALGANRPVFAVLVPLVGMSGDPFGALSVSIDRILGIFAGVGIGLGLVHVGLHQTLLVALALAAGGAAGVVLRIGQRLNLQPAISALFMLGVAGSTGAGVARVWESAIGAAFTLPVSALLWPPDPLGELEARIERLRQELASDLAAVAEALATGGELELEEVREHSRAAMRDFFELEPARRALRLSPLRRRDLARLPDAERRVELAARVYRHARAVARDVRDARIREPALAAATRNLADAADRALTHRDPGEALVRAEWELATPVEGEALIVAAQLRQLLADVHEQAGAAAVVGPLAGG
jgi:uncharacterized membrane protein YgaE (UPF0421/DUF939 family)